LLIQVQRVVCDELKAYLQEYDALLTPATPDVAYEIGEKIMDPLQMYTGDLMTVNVNLAGLPAIVVRSSRNLCKKHADADLPIGIQFIGKHFGEDQLLEIAHIFETCTLEDSSQFPEADFLSFLH
jgi:aspartyl-tRNA(Asn)/glutamyl-tRNA(Gln) amidotransferase subunit A